MSSTIQEHANVNDMPAAVRTVAVLGGSYGGARAASMLAESLPEGWRVVLVDRNTHANNVYNLPRYGVLPGHEHKAFIPYTNIFHASTHPNGHTTIHGTITSLHSHSLTITTPIAESTEVQFDYAIYALGSHLPAPINLWGPSPSVSSNKPTAAEVLRPHYGGTKAESIAWLKEHQHAVQSAESVLVVGGGALGIQYATDISAVHPEKQITLLHSRHRLLPKFDESMHSEIIQAMEESNINIILGERLDLSSTTQDPPKRNEVGQRVVRTVTGREISADLILLCTGQNPNVQLLSSLDPCSISPETGMARVLRTMQLASPALRLAPCTPFTEREPPLLTPMGEPAYAHAGDPGVDGEELELALEGLTLEDPHAADGISPRSSPTLSVSSFGSSSTATAGSSPMVSSTPMTPLSPAPAELEMETRFPHLFVVGDAADAFGAINAGHTAYFQAEVAAKNVLKMIRRESGELSDDDDLEFDQYTPTPPGIKVSLGLRKSVYQMQGVVGTKDDGKDDLDAALLWGYFGMSGVSEEGMYA